MTKDSMKHAHFMYDIFGQPYVGHMRPEHYQFLKSLPSDLIQAINESHKIIGQQVMNKQNSIEAEFERVDSKHE